MITATEVVEDLRANYFAGEDFVVRSDTDPSGFARILVLVSRAGLPTRLFGLRLIDFPASPPTLRFWHPARWTEESFTFDFTSTGDVGSVATVSSQGVPTMCIPYHLDYYRGSWHTDQPWIPSAAATLIADLASNILRRV